MHGHEPDDCDACKLYDARQRQIAEATPVAPPPTAAGDTPIGLRAVAFSEAYEMRHRDSDHFHDPECELCQLYAAESDASPTHDEYCEGVARWRAACAESEADVVRLRDDLLAATRELHRHRHGNTIEGDDVCGHELDAVNLRTALAAVIDAFGLRKSYCSGVAADVLREALALLEGGAK